MLAQKFAVGLFEEEAIQIAKRAWDFTFEEQDRVSLAGIRACKRKLP
jgi:hypothetical protein